MTQPSTKLSYFDFNVSRGLECRLALTVAGVEFEDHRVQREEWATLKPSTPFGALPVLSLSGGERRLAHSTAILTYIGRTHDLHPADPWRAAEHEAAMHAVEDLRSKMPGTRDMTAEEKRETREAFAAGWLTQWARTLSEVVQGPFVDGKRLQVADLKLYTILRAFLSGEYDHIPGSFFDAYPKLLALHTAVDAHPTVKAYLEGR